MLCKRPFMHVTVRPDGSYSPCCIANQDDKKTVREMKPSEWWNSDYMEDFRRRHIEGDKSNLPECTRCWKNEDQGYESLRTKTNRSNPDVTEKAEMPYDWELNLSNICNAGCMMCSGMFSSLVAHQNEKLGIEDEIPPGYDKKTLIEEVTSSRPKLLNIIGGEPMTIPEVSSILNMLNIAYGSDSDYQPSDDCKLHFTTNGTYPRRQMRESIENYDNIRTMLSIEGVGEFNDFMRHPLKWAEVHGTLTWWKARSQVILNSVVQNLNLIEVPNLIEFARSENLFLVLEPLRHPTYLRPEVVTEEYLAEVQKVYQEYDGWDYIHLMNGPAVRDQVMNLTPDQTELKKMQMIVQAKTKLKSEGSVKCKIPEQIYSLIFS